MPNQADNTVSLFCEQVVEMLDQAAVKLEHCLGQLSDEQIWWRPQATINSVGNLVLHLCGNLRQWTVTAIN